MAKKIVIVAGSPGAGKTTILKEFANMKNAVVMNIGTLMLEAGLERGYIKTRDEMRYLRNDKLNELRAHAISKIHAMHHNVVLDTHASVGENGRYLPGLPIDALTQFRNITGLIYIDAVTEDLLEHRRHDVTRKREKEDEPMINDQRLINLAALTVASSYLNVPLFVVVNKHGPDGISKSVKEVEARLDELLGD